MPRANEEVEELLSEWAELLQVSGVEMYRVRAYEKAARAIGGYSTDIKALSEREILQIPSVGKGMAARVREYLETGTMRELEDLREMVPAGMRELMRVPGLGPKKAIVVYQELGVSSVEELAEAIKNERLRGIKGLGPKTEANLARAIENLRKHGERILIDSALDTAEGVIRSLREGLDMEKIAFAGSLRRMRDSIGDVDILVASGDAAPVMESFTTMPRVSQVLAKGDTKSSVLTRKGLQVDLRVVPEESWGAALIYFTGSKAHNIKIREIAIKKGMKLSEWGLFEAETGKIIAAESEEIVYDALGLPWIPPALREDRGEIAAALADELPPVVTESDIQGDLHSHTNMTDGLASLEEMVAAASARGYAYYAITDHAEDLSMTGASREKMIDQRERIATLQKKYPKLTLLHGSELNIGKDGGVDYDPEFLAGFDILVASVHSYFRLSREETTKRVIAAMENPFVNVIGHPSGRLIGKREPIDFDFAAVCDAAVRTGTALEVNCFPDRLDLRDEHVRWAIERGVTLSIDTDSHTPK
ncbi:MAG TPA: DNA polymerase/3'-5' exonuclease PolX, partial [Actinomycetota bacterium]|nr:DNA polymerase/3'-5' exonuclease PolX [Actinomycetota bacterium]